MGLKNGKLGAFPSNFAKEIFVSPKGWWLSHKFKKITFAKSNFKLTLSVIFLTDGRYSEGKTRPKLTDAVFTKEVRPAETSSSNF